MNFPIDQWIDRRWSVHTGLLDRIKNVEYTVYEEGIYVGYRWFNTMDMQVSYPFGYGLSYTSFEYGTPSVKHDGENIVIEVSIKNVGTMAGKEVVQLYVEAPKSKLDKPIHELRAFDKTDMLKPGESQTITLTVHPDDLASFDEELSAWITDAGTYNFVVSASSRDPRGSVKVDVQQSIRKVNDVLNIPENFKKKKKLVIFSE